MKKLISYTAILSLIILSGCSKISKDQVSQGLEPQDPDLAAAFNTLIKFHDEQKDFPMFTRSSESNNRARGKTQSKTSGLERNADFSFNSMLVDIALGQASYTCYTAVDEYIGSIISDWGDEEFGTYGAYSDMIWFWHFYINHDESDEYFGMDGEYTKANTKTFSDLENFWDVSQTIVFKGAHGSFFDDTDKLIETLNFYRTYGLMNPATTDAQIEAIANAVQTVFGSDAFWNLEHPLLSFNAIAGGPDAFFTDIPYKIVMGDGIQDAYNELGYGDVATQAVLAHEYGHQVQFSNNLTFDFTPAGTREAELMADALAAYYLTHKRGATMNWKRVEQFLAVYFTIGDCQFDNPNHHGAPEQRLAAAQFGYDVANDTQKKGQIMSSEDFISLFYANLDDILAAE